MKLSLSRSDDTPLPWLDDGLVRALRDIALVLGPPDRNVDLVVVDDDAIRDINRTFRGQDRPTDVISFSYIDDAATPAGEDDIAGEIYVSHRTVAAEAEELGVDPGHLFLRVGVHGLLHVVGRDHATDPDADSMEAEERAALSRHLAPADVEALF